MPQRKNWRDSIPRPPPLLYPSAPTPASDVIQPASQPPLLGELMIETSQNNTPILYPSAGTSNPPGNQSVSVVGGSSRNKLEDTIASLTATIQQLGLSQVVSNQLNMKSTPLLSVPKDNLGVSTSSHYTSQQHLPIPNNLMNGNSIGSIQTPSGQNHLTVGNQYLTASMSSMSPPVATPYGGNAAPQSYLGSPAIGNLGASLSTASHQMGGTIRQSPDNYLTSPRQNLGATVESATREELLAQTIGSLNQALGQSVNNLEETVCLNPSQFSPQEDLVATIASLQKGILGNTVPSVSTDVEPLPIDVPHLTVSRASEDQHFGYSATPTVSGQHLSALPLSTPAQESLASVLRVATEDIIDKDSLFDYDIGLPTGQGTVTPAKKKRRKKVKRGTKSTPSATNITSVSNVTPIRTPPSEVLVTPVSCPIPQLNINTQEDLELHKSFEGINLSKYGNVGDPNFKMLMMKAVRAAETARKQNIRQQPKPDNINLSENYQKSIETSSTSIPPPFTLPEDNEEEDVQQRLQSCSFHGYNLPHFPFVSHHPSTSREMSFSRKKSIRTPASDPTSADLFTAVNRALGVGTVISSPSISIADDGIPDVVTLAKRLAYDLRSRPTSPPPIPSDIVAFPSARLM